MGFAGSQFHQGPGPLYINDPLKPFLPPTVYENTEQTATNTCPEGSISEPIVVTIPAGTYTSTLSQEAVDAIALAAAVAEADAEREASPCEYPPDDQFLFSTGYNGYGSLGLGDFLNRFVFTQVGSLTTWVNLGSGATSECSFLVRDDGTLWGAGSNYDGELGVGDTTHLHENFIQVGTDSDWPVTGPFVAGGNQHTLFLKSDGTLWATGRNNLYQFGNGTTTNSLVPIQIGVDTWLTLAAGSTWSAGIKTDGTLWGWGNNGDGQLGQGDLVARTTPTQIGVATNWISVRAGDVFLMALNSAGEIWCCGEGFWGSLGQGDYADHTTLVQVAGDWTYISAGYQAAYAINAVGELWTWGNNDLGQLGQGLVGGKTNTPGQVGSSTNWTKIGGGDGSAMGTKADGTLWGMGDNGNGSIGLGGDIAQAILATQVGVETTWTDIATGAEFSFGLKT